MKDLQQVAHEGIVQDVNHGMVKVCIQAYSACSDCHAKSLCSLSDKKDKIIEVQDSGNNFSIGDRVEVSLEKDQGLKAVFWAYFLPFIIFLTVLFLSSEYVKNEAIVGAIALFSMIPYYSILYLTKHQFGRSMSMHIHKIQQNQ